MSSQGRAFVEVKRVTWSKDSHGLFDYESKNVNFDKDKVEESSHVFKAKEGNGIQIQKLRDVNQPMEVENPNYLFSIVNTDGKNEKFELRTPHVHGYDSTKQNLFLIVRSLKNEEGVQRGYPLELGDILRLGRIEYKVIEYRDSDGLKHSLYDMHTPTQAEEYNINVKKCEVDLSGNSKTQCRICLMEDQEDGDYIVNLCHCKGTGGSVHMKCVQNWINSKVKIKQTAESQCRYWKQLICEICKAPLPDLIDVNGKYIQVIHPQGPDTPYMLLERIFYDRSKGGDSSKMLILLSISNDSHSIKLGRGHDCDLRENDISVSRLHAYIKHINKKFVILDNNSKFGTLILMRKGFEIEKRKIALQLGRTVVTFSLKQQAPNGNSSNILKNPLMNEKGNNNHMQQEDFAEETPYGGSKSTNNGQGTTNPGNVDGYNNFNLLQLGNQGLNQMLFNNASGNNYQNNNNNNPMNQGIFSNQDDLNDFNMN